MYSKKKKPVAICKTKHSPKREAKFQNVEIFLGKGISTKVLLAILNSG